MNPRIWLVGLVVAGLWMPLAQGSMELRSEISIDLEMRVLAFEPEVIEVLMRRSPMLTADELLALFADGQGEMAYPPIMVPAQSGQEVVVKAVSERIFAHHTGTIPREPQPIPERVGVPDDFGTREVGVVFRAVPRVMADNATVLIDIEPQVVREREPVYETIFISWPERDVDPIKIPLALFRTLSAQLSTHMRDRETILLGSDTDHANGKLLFMLLTIRIRKYNIEPFYQWAWIVRELESIHPDPYGSSADAVSLADAVMEAVESDDTATARTLLEAYRAHHRERMDAIEARLKAAGEAGLQATP